jgi:hypothetical protein
MAAFFYFVVTVDTSTKRAKQIYYADLTIVEISHAMKQKIMKPKVNIKPMLDDPQVRLRIFNTFMYSILRLNGKPKINDGVLGENIESITLLPTSDSRLTGKLTDFIDQTVRITTQTKDGDIRVHPAPVRIQKAGGDWDRHFNLGNGAMIFMGPSSRTTNHDVSANGEVFYRTVDTIISVNILKFTIGGFMTLRFEYLEEK